MQAVPVRAACNDSLSIACPQLRFAQRCYDAQNRPAIVEWNNGITTAKYAYIQNLQGDIVGIVDSSGTEVTKYTYDAWGKVLSTTGSLASALGTVQPFRYRGYVYDVETGLYYLRSRYYNFNWQRFVNADVCIVHAKPNGQNLFCYSYNSPINHKDENGYLPFDPFPTLLDAVDDFYNNYGNQDYEFGTIFMRNRDNPEIYYYREPVQGTTSSVQPQFALPLREEFLENEIIAYAHTHPKYIDDYGVYVPSYADVDHAKKYNPELTITPDANIYRIYIHHMDGSTPIMHIEVLRGPKELVQYGNDFEVIDFFVIMHNYLNSISFEGG